LEQLVDVLVDTNVVLRRLQRTHPQHRKAREAIARFSKEDDRICVTSQNLVELWAVLTRPVENNGFGLTPAQADRVLARVESSVFRLPDSDDVYAEWRRLVVTHGVSGKKTHDARLVAAMTVNRIVHILTFNTDDFSRYSGIRVLDPTKL
jgi:predicted nucleic acid-binding protein